MATQVTNDFMILGPSMTSGNAVLDAVYALYFLPENFKLVLTGSNSADQSFFGQIQALIGRNELDHRVVFRDSFTDPHAVVLPNTGMSRASNSVAGDSPEALASALLDLYRSRA